MMKMNIQKFAGKTNVFPVSDNKFKIGESKESATVVADLETFLHLSPMGWKHGHLWIRKDGRDH